MATYHKPLPLFAPKRPPFSDWLAQIERRAFKPVRGVIPSRYLQGCYDCGLTPQEMAEEFSH